MARRERAATMSELSNEVSIAFPNACKQPNKAHVARMVRRRRRISIARGNLLTTLIRCAVVWMKERRGISRRGSSRDSKGSRGKKESRGRDKRESRGRGKKGNRGNKGR